MLDVGHERISVALHLGEVEVALQVETRGPSTAPSCSTHLRARGYTRLER